MTNQLTKNTNISYLPGSPGVAAYPGQPYQAAYSAVEPQTVCGYVTTGGSWQWVKDDQGQYQYVLVPEAGQIASSYYACSEQQVPVYHPEQPYIAPTAGVASTAEQIVYDFNLGWNSGARSQGFFLNDGFTSFKASPSLVGAVAGLNYTDPDAGYVNIDYAFYISNGIVRVMEAGVEKAYVGPAAAGDVFMIARRLGVVSYYVNDVLKYVSLTPSFGITFLDVSLYSGGDYLDSPSIAAYASAGDSSAVGVGPDGSPYALISGALNLQPMAMSGGTAATATASLTLRPMAMASSPYQGGTLNLLPMTLKASNFAYGEAAMSFAPMTIDAKPGAMVPTYAVASLPMVGLTMSGHGLTGGIGQGGMVLAPMAMSAGRAGYGEARLSVTPMTMYASAYEGNQNASMRELVVSRSTASYFGYVDVRLFSGASAADEYLTLVLKDAAMAEQADATDTLQYSAVLLALMNTEVDVFAGVPVLTQDGDVWVVNDETGASVAYEGYSFNSFGRYQGKYLGAKPDGIYLLEGDTDAGMPIRSSISLGRQDFGTTALKSVANCYVGVASTGGVYLKVLANGVSHLYKTARSDDYLRTQRVPVGRGLRATHMTFELYNEAGADFEMASIEFEAAVLSRRI